MKSLFPSNKSRSLLLYAVGGIAALCALYIGGTTIIRTSGLLPTKTPALAAANLAWIQPTSPILPSFTPKTTVPAMPGATLAITATIAPTLLQTQPHEGQCVPQGTTRQTGVVVWIADGDTIRVRLDDGNIFPVRYIGMDTPEDTTHGDPFAIEATMKNWELVNGKTVTLVKDVSETDQYNRLLRYVFVDDIFVNYELVKLGYAQAATYPPDVACADTFKNAQHEAKLAGIGLWGTPPTSPVNGNAHVIIQSIFYQGVVPKVESDEYAEIANAGSEQVTITGWRLNAGALGQDFFFPDFIIKPGQSCRVYTNEDHPDSCGFNFRSPNPVWNNTSDCGYLYDPMGFEISKKCYP